ncbi:hypothetical protein RFI_17822 [Reticulomyxa filosa]|uniref:Acyltransferase 3 domain-containing protein n=1 Tax=Reticulomyxa filosa TaxID=46433 RepID=X6MZG6_RETFI|nr:hypothetical protein RFI_17822 [Reticulomyxa filosa]|eukprot:ETO19410.1 hypothetical protein RFI_17822 [Reticulomyxa filosa]
MFEKKKKKRHNCKGEDAEKVMRASTYCYGSFDEFVSAVYGTAADVGVYCSIPPRKFDDGAIFVIVLFAVFACLVLVTTMYRQCVVEYLAALWSLVAPTKSQVDRYTDENGRLANIPLMSIDDQEREGAKATTTTIATVWSSVVSTFCLQDAWKSFTKKRDKNDLAFLDGLRWWSMTWVVLGHAYFIILEAPTDNLLCLAPFVTSAPSFYHYQINDFYTTFPLAGFYGVDTFFWLSGLLAAMSLLKFIVFFFFYIVKYVLKKKKKQKLDF